MARVGVYHRTKESVMGGGGRAGVEDFGYVIIVFVWSSLKASWYSESPPLPLIGHQFSVVYSLYILL